MNKKSATSTSSTSQPKVVVRKRAAMVLPGAEHKLYPNVTWTSKKQEVAERSLHKLRRELAHGA